MVDKVNLTMYQGSDFRRVLEFRNDLADLMNLTGYTFRGQARTGYGSKLVFEFVCSVRDQDVSMGLVDIHVSAATTASLNITKTEEYLFDIEMVDDSDDVKRIMEGKIKLYPEVTK